MKIVLRGIVLCSVLGAAAMVPAQMCQGQVVINEILGDPARDWDGDGVVNFKDDEWVEIANLGATAVQLDSFRLSDASNTFRFGFQGSLVAGGHFVVYGSESVAWEVAEGVSTVGLSLNNGGDTVRLWQLAGAETLLVDEYTYAAHEAEDDRSTGRVPDNTGTWVLFDSLNPWTGAAPPASTECPPTPGDGNHCPTAIEGTTWTSLKGLFRGTPREETP
jgi:hypothetical protein